MNCKQDLFLKCICLVAIILLIVSCQNPQHRIYVMPDYPIKGDLTEELSVNSIQAALDSVVKLKEKGEVGPIEILLNPGTYTLSEPLILTDKHSGSPAYPLEIKPASEGNVIISGSKRMNLQWVQVRDSLWKTDIGERLEIDQLFLNGKKQIRARYPNYDSTVLVYHGYAEDAISPDRIAGWKDPGTGIFHAMHVAEWGDYHYRITGVAGDGNAILEGGYQNNRQMGMHLEYRYVENIREELDAPGEWFYDENKNEIYFINSKGVDLNKMTVEIPVIESLVIFSGSSDAPVHDIIWKKSVFQQTNYTFMKTDEPLLRSDWKIHRGGAMLLEGAENIRIENNRFQMIGGNGVFVSGYNRNVQILGNHLTDVGASGICFVGRPEAVRSPSFEYHEFVEWEDLDRETGPKSNDYPLDCKAHDNLIHDIGQVEKQVAGIQISMALGIIVSHNSIYNMPRAGINIGDGTWGGHIIEYNDVFNTVLETGDHGAFNSWGRDRFWHPDRKRMNEITTKDPSLIFLDALDTTLIRNNRFRCDHGWDIDLDDGSSNYRIYNNLCLNGGIKLREGFYRTVENNIMINNSFHPHVWFEESHDIFRYNIVATWYKPIRVNGWGNEIDYNLLPDSSALARSQELGLDKHSLFGDPQYIDPESGNFQVAINSPAMQVGFVNFTMDEFGVVSSHLKDLAQTPDIPMLYPVGKEEADDIFDFIGADVKKLHGLGERSAVGIDQERGVLVVKVPENSVAGNGGLYEADVILALNEIKTNSIRQLFEAYQGENWKGEVMLKVFRNQQVIELQVKL